MIGIDINGLNLEDQQRIQVIGLQAWMDEVVQTDSKPSRYSLEYRQNQTARPKGSDKQPVVVLPEIVCQTPASSDALEEHPAAPSVKPLEPVELASVAEPSLPSVRTHNSAATAVAVEQRENVNIDSDTDNDFDRPATVNDFNKLQTPKIDEEPTCVGQHLSEQNTASEPIRQLSVSQRRNKKRNLWSGYQRPEPMPRTGPQVEYPEREEFLVRARTFRQSPVHKTVSVPAYVKDARIAEQDGRCVYCQRQFGAPILHNGEVEILEPQLEHFVPRAASGRTTDSNVTYADQVCNRLKSDFIFDTVEEVTEFLAREWTRTGYTNCPLLIPFKRGVAANAGMYN